MDTIEYATFRYGVENGLKPGRHNVIMTIADTLQSRQIRSKVYRVYKNVDLLGRRNSN